MLQKLYTTIVLIEWFDLMVVVCKEPLGCWNNTRTTGRIQSEKSVVGSISKSEICQSVSQSVCLSIALVSWFNVVQLLWVIGVGLRHFPITWSNDSSFNTAPISLPLAPVAASSSSSPHEAILPRILLATIPVGDEWMEWNEWEMVW